MVTFGEFEALLTGDGTYETQEKILERYDSPWLDVEVLKVGHHGSYSTGFVQRPETGWLQAVRPVIGVASASGYIYGHPSRDVLEELFEFTIGWAEHPIRWGFPSSGSHSYEVVNRREAVFTTPTSGNIVVRSDGSSFQVR